MSRILFGALGLFALTPALLCAQTGSPPVRKTGAIVASEVDALVGLLRSSALGAKLPALGGESALDTAKVLTAMGHCHRRYHRADGPVVRPSLEFLIRQRRADGSFGDAATTAWTVDALDVIDGPGYAEEIAAARAWLQKQPPAPAFAAAVEAVLQHVRADVFPQHLARQAAQQVADWRAAPADLPRSEAAEALVHLVACQVANRRLDAAAAQDPAQGGEGKAAVWDAAQEQAFAWLFAQQKEGVFAVTMGGKSFPDPALTGFGLLALQTKPKAKRTAAEQAAIEQGLRWLLKTQNEDGTFGQNLPNYTTCVVVAALARFPDPAVAPALQRAQKAILGFQNAEQGGYARSDRDYGSIGYGNAQRGDLSNLHFSLEALRASGLPADHEAFQKALVFLQRTQNLKSHNDFSGKVPDPDRPGVMLDSTSGDDGGAAYLPGNSQAGYVVLPDGKSVPRSYGSMTYALLKSYTLAGLSGDDPRVRAAVDWIQKNWTLAMNPGADPALGEKVKYQGLFYYYMVLAQALDLAKVKTVMAPGPKDDKGQPTTQAIDWKQALREHLTKTQQADGTWVNGKNDRWMEGLPLLCTCYALVALEHCQ